MSSITFKSKLFTIYSQTVLVLPKEVSEKLPSRGMVMVKGVKANSGDTVPLEIETTKEWIEPDVPIDLKKALGGSPKAQALWKDITPMTHWDWIRWIRAVKTLETRQKHIEVALSKLNKGMRRPYCFNRNLCSEPAVSHNWVLLEPR